MGAWKGAQLLYESEVLPGSGDQELVMSAMVPSQRVVSNLRVVLSSSVNSEVSRFKGREVELGVKAPGLKVGGGG